MSVHGLTEKWMEQLPAGHPMVGREQLKNSDWPEWLVQWVEQGIATWIRESLEVPDIPLARMDSEEVLESWRTFEATVIRHWAFPVNEMQPLLEELAEDLLALLSRPEARIPALLFGSERSIDRKLLASRLERVVVHQDLARALLRYAERKELQQIDRELAGRVIVQVDQKLRERYDADAWAAQLSPLFELWGGTVPSGMIREQLEVRGADAAGRIPDGETRRTIEWVVRELRKGPVDEEESAPTSLSDLYGSMTESPEPEEPEETSDGEELSLHKRFQFDEPDLNEYLEKQETPAEPPEELNEKEDPLDEESEERKDVETKPPLSLYAEPEEDSGEPDAEGDENAIWKKFLAPDTEGDSEEQETDIPEEEASAVSGSSDSESGSESDDGGGSLVGWLDPAETAFGAESSQVIQELEEWLGSDLGRFREEIFDGSEEGLRAALRDLARIESWGDASRYLQDDVFDRYRIDLFDDAAVDFTDRMQAWFEEVNHSRS